MESEELIRKYKAKIEDLNKDIENALSQNNNSTRSDYLIIPLNWRYYYEKRLSYLSDFISFTLKLIAFICFIYLIVVFFLDVYHIYNESINQKNGISTKTRLEFIEHIFINFIPFLVVLGLSYYYEKTFAWQIFKKDSEPPKNLLMAAKENMNMTKTLFLSSIMSYTILKIIEVLFYSSKEEEITMIDNINDLNFLNLIPHFLFLIILMAYLIVLHKHPKE